MLLVDIARPEFKERKRRRQIVVAALAVVVATVLTVIVYRLRPAAPTVERSTVWTDSVKRGSILRQVMPTDFGGALLNAFNGIAPDYYVGFDRNIPLRNRVAKPDQYRSELEYRQAELRLEELKKQVRIEVPNAPPNVI